MARNDLVYDGDNPFLTDGSSLATSLGALQNDHRMIELQSNIAQEIQKSKQRLFDSIQKQTDELNQLTISNEFIKRFNQIYLENSTNPEAFKEQIDSVRDELLGTIPNVEQRAFLRAQFDKDIDGGYLSASKNFLKASIQDTFDQSKDAINNAAVSASIAINTMFDSGNEDQAVIDESLTKLGEAYLNVETILSSKDVNGNSYFNETQKKELRDGFEASVLEAYCRRQMQSLPISGQIEFVKNFNEGKSILSIPIGEDKAIHVSGRELSFKNFNSLSKSLMSQLVSNAQTQKDQRNLSFLEDVVAGKINPDPKDQKYRKDSDLYYNSFVKPLVSFETPEDVQQSVNLVGSMIDKLHTIPTQIESDLRACLESGDFNRFSYASNVLKNVSTNNPTLLEFFDKKDFAKAFTMNKLTSAGVAPEEAFNQVTKGFSSVNEDIRKNRIVSFNKEVNGKRSDFESSIMKEGWFFKKNKELSSLTSDEFFYQFTDLAREYYAQGATFDVARDSALAAMKERWGNSEVNGDNYLTALPPEKFYSDYAMNGKIMRELLLKFVKEKTDEKLEDDRIVVLADRETYATAGNQTSKPSYSLCYINEMGVPEPILGEDLQPIRIGENVWNKESRFEYEKDIYFANKRDKKEIDLIELFEGEEF